jgi:hypothetical protein
LYAKGVASLGAMEHATVRCTDAAPQCCTVILERHPIPWFDELVG